MRSLNQPLELRDDLEVDEPHEGEVTVRMAAAGVCHSDLAMQTGVTPICLPAVLGHEGAAWVEQVGAGVDGLTPGDLVVLSWVPQCGECWFCQRGQGQLCQRADVPLITGGLLDGTPRFRDSRGPVFQMTACGAFAERTTVPASGVTKVPGDLDPSLAALISCSVLTGVGAALNTARITPGDTVAIIGCGGVGLNVVQGARIAGAAEIVAVDLHQAKLDLARELGATTTVKAGLRGPNAVAGLRGPNAVAGLRGPNAVAGRRGPNAVAADTDPATAVMNLTAERGADVVFEAIGRKATMEQAMAMTRRGGQTVLVGIPSLDVTLSIPAMVGLIVAEKTLKGCWYGSSNVRRDIPRVVELYRSGELRLDPLVGRRVDLSEVNDALTALQTGEEARSVIVY